MKFFALLRSVAANLFHRSETEKEMDEELRSHILERTDDLERGGLPRAEAERRARMEFGGVERFKEEVRETRWGNQLESLFRDFRYALRSLRRDRKFVVMAVFALALGIGAATVAFSAFYNLSFNAFAAKDAGRLVVLAVQNAESLGLAELNLQPLGGSLSDLEAIRNQNHVFEEIIGYGRSIVLLNDGSDNHQLYVARVTGNAFDFYGVGPLLGRGILPEDSKPAATPIFVMSYRTWRGEFRGDSNILGKSYLIDGKPRTLVGIMPPRFQAFGALQQGWIPITDTREAAGSGGEPSVDTMMARLKPGVSIEEASAEVDVIVKRLAKGNPKDFPKHFTAQVESVTDFSMSPWGMGSAGGPETEHFDIKHMLCDLLAGVMLLLLIACSGVANLLLVRGAAREKEIALRAALGATRWRLLRQLMVESSVLSITACVLGCVLAYWGMRGVAAVVPHKGASIGGEAVIGLNSTVLFFTLGVTAVTTLLCGLAPALHAVGRDLQTQLTGSGSGTGESLRRGKFRAVLVIVEVALSIVLLTGAGLMIRSFYQLTHIDLGFNAKNLLLVAAGSRRRSDGKLEQQAIKFKTIVERLKTLPGVTELAINNSLPGYNPSRRYEAAVPGSTHSERAGFDKCSESLLRTLEMQMVSGRWLSESDVDSARHVTVINKTMATHFFGMENPLGRQVVAKGFEDKAQPPRDAYFQVIGVVRDVKDFGPQVPVLPMAFIPYTLGDGGLSYVGGGILFLRTKGDPALMMNAVRQEVWAVDRDAIFSPETGPYIEEFYRLTYSAHELGLTTFTGVAGIALVLVVIGVFSVMAYTVSLRTREIGVRMALGAQQNEILRMVLRKGFVLLVAGICIGLIASYGLTRFLASQIWGVSATDPWTFGAVAALVVGAGLAACYLPARRATEVDPLVALRYE
jgi:putative ABC transport system permease protein